MKTAIKKKSRSLPVGASKKIKKLRFNLVGKESQKPELKVVDVNDAGSAPVVNLVSTTATVALLNGLDLGTGAFQRLGRSVHLRTLHVRGGFYPSLQDGSFGGECLRVLVVYDRQPNGVAPSVIDIMQSIDANGNGSTTPFDYPNLANSERFIILADKQVNLSNTRYIVASSYFGQQNTLSELDSSDRNFDRYIDVSGLPTQYKGDDETVASISTGALFLYTLGSQAAATAGVTFNWTARLRYSDA